MIIIIHNLVNDIKFNKRKQNAQFAAALFRLQPLKALLFENLISVILDVCLKNDHAGKM